MSQTLSLITVVLLTAAGSGAEVPAQAIPEQSTISRPPSHPSTHVPFALRKMLFQQVHRQLTSTESLYQLSSRDATITESATQRWVGAYSFPYWRPNQQYCEFEVPAGPFGSLGFGQASYIYCDLHTGWPGDAGGVFSQFTPQLMRGYVLSEVDENYSPTYELLDGWWIQSQYIFSIIDRNGQSQVKGYVGKKIQVQTGDVIWSRVYKSCDFSHRHGGWVLEIGVKGRQDISSLFIEQPFMGLDPNYPMAYCSSNAPDDYSELISGCVHEAWRMDEPDYYPYESWWFVWYSQHAGFPVPMDGYNMHFAKYLECVDHTTSAECPNNDMTVNMIANWNNYVEFTVNRSNALHENLMMV